MKPAFEDFCAFPLYAGSYTFVKVPCPTNLTGGGDKVSEILTLGTDLYFNILVPHAPARWRFDRLRFLARWSMLPPDAMGIGDIHSIIHPLAQQCGCLLPDCSPY